MELWIRSQDRETLMLANYFEIEQRDKNFLIMARNGDPYFDQCLGLYKTKKRALEVLDDIEDKLINCTFAKKQNGLGEVLDFMPNSIYVYTMPKE